MSGEVAVRGRVLYTDESAGTAPVGRAPAPACGGGFELGDVGAGGTVDLARSAGTQSRGGPLGRRGKVSGVEASGPASGSGRIELGGWTGELLTPGAPRHRSGRQCPVSECENLRVLCLGNSGE